MSMRFKIWFLSLAILLWVGMVPAWAQVYRVGDLYTAPDGSQGIVYWLNPDGSGGWVVALNDASTGCPWGAAGDIPGLDNRNPGNNNRQQLLTDTAGYANTQAIRSYQNNVANTAAGVVDFAHGWCLPSPAQLSILYGQFPFIEAALVAAGGTVPATGNYWCSAEVDGDNAWYVRFSYGSFYSSGKTSNCSVRAVRSFTYPSFGAVSYTWSDGSTGSSVTVSPTADAIWSVTATAGNCTDNDLCLPCRDLPVAVTVGSGTASSNGNHLPLETYYKFSYTQQIVPATQLNNEAQSFSNIAFQYFYPSTFDRNVDIYLAHVPANLTLADGWIRPSDTTGIVFTRVFSGTVTLNNMGTDYWYVFPFTDNFNYNGTDNLLIAMLDHSGYWTDNASKFYSHSDASTVNMARWVRRDGSTYDPFNPDATGSVSNYVNNIRFNSFSAGNLTSNSADLYWGEDANASFWNVEYKLSGNSRWISAGTTDTTFCHLTGLTPNTGYTVRVQAICNGGSSVGNWSEVTFTTSCNRYSITVTNFDTTVCAMAFPLTWRGHTFPDTGSYTMPLQDAYGCDSTVTLRVNSVVNGAFGVTLGNLYFERAASEERFVLVVDYDNDSKKDLITRIHPSGEVRFYRSTGSTYVYDFSLNAQSYAFSAAMDENNNGQSNALSNFADFDNDGVKDLLVYGADHGTCGSNSVRIYWGSASHPYFNNSTYTELAVSSPSCVGAYGEDLNHDGLRDVLIRNCGPTNLYMNNGSRSFTNTSVFNTGRDINVIFDDYDADGNVDLCYTKNGWASGGWGIRLNKGNGDGTFNTSTISNYDSEHPLDGFVDFQANPLDNTLPDIAFTCSNDGTNNSTIYVGEWNGSAGNFQFHTLSVTPSDETRIVQAFDINGDSYDDLIIRSRSGDFYSAKAYINDGHGNFPYSISILKDSPYYPYEFHRQNGQILMVAYHGTSRDQIVVYEINPVLCGIDALPCPGTPTVTDYDGNVYNTIQLGNQCWMKENLRTTHFADGVEIPASTTVSSTEPYRHLPGSNPVATYGYLYNWTALMHGAASSSANPSAVQGICPAGWHVPSDAEWTQLTDYLSSQSRYVCGDNSSNIAKALAATTGWAVNTNSNTTCTVGGDQSTNNATGFGAMQAGGYHSSGFGSTTRANLWSCTQSSDNIAWYRYLSYLSATVGRNNQPVSAGYSVRCLLGAGNTRAAAVGDVLCTDGTWVSPCDYAASGKTAMGVIFYVDDSGYHGWAVHLTDDCTGCKWGVYGTDIPDLPNITGDAAAYADTAGYSNTQIIRNYGDAVSFPAAWAVDFDHGWYLPAHGQLYTLHNVHGSVEPSLTAVGGTVLGEGNQYWYYWSSTEHNESRAWNVVGIGGYANFLLKYIPCNVRSVRSF